MKYESYDGIHVFTDLYFCVQKLNYFGRSKRTGCGKRLVIRSIARELPTKAPTVLKAVTLQRLCRVSLGKKDHKDFSGSSLSKRRAGLRSRRARLESPTCGLGLHRLGSHESQVTIFKDGVVETYFMTLDVTVLAESRNQL